MSKINIHPNLFENKEYLAKGRDSSISQKRVKQMTRKEMYALIGYLLSVHENVQKRERSRKEAIRILFGDQR